MRKLKLSLDALQVESFHATDPDARRGTVPAHGWTDYNGESCDPSCAPNCSQIPSCAGSCNTGYASCGGTCTCPPPATGYTECNCQTWETCPGAGICA